MGKASHSRGDGPSDTVVSAAEKVGAARGTIVEAEAAHGSAVDAAWGRNPGWTTGARRRATSGSNLGGTSGAGWQGATVPAVVSRVPMVETVESDSQRKSRPVGLGEAARGKLSSSKTKCREMIKRFVERSRQW
jgi:hypothetical protein